MLKRFAYLMIVVGLVVLAGQSLTAAAPSSIRVTNLAFTSCTNSNLSGSYSVEVLDAFGNVLNVTTPMNIQRVYTAGNDTEEFTGYLASTDLVPIDISFQSEPTTVNFVVSLVDDPSITTSVYVFDCANGVIAISENRDDRLNYQKGDLLAALYLRADSEGNPIVKVYEILSDSKGKYIGEFTYADFELYIKTPPTHNTLIETIGQTSLYALTTGEFQFNIGPDKEGKVISVILRTFPGHAVYSYTWLAQ